MNYQILKDKGISVPNLRPSRRDMELFPSEEMEIDEFYSCLLVEEPVEEELDSAELEETATEETEEFCIS